MDKNMTLLLLEQGADLTKKNHAGVSPQELAAKSESMRQLLIGISNKKKRLLIFFFFFLRAAFKLRRKQEAAHAPLVTSEEQQRQRSASNANSAANASGSNQGGQRPRGQTDASRYGRPSNS